MWRVTDKGGWGRLVSVSFISTGNICLWRESRESLLKLQGQSRDFTHQSKALLALRHLKKGSGAGADLDLWSRGCPPPWNKNIPTITIIKCWKIDQIRSQPGWFLPSNTKRWNCKLEKNKLILMRKTEMIVNFLCFSATSVTPNCSVCLLYWYSTETEAAECERFIFISHFYLLLLRSEHQKSTRLFSPDCV